MALYESEIQYCTTMDNVLIQTILAINHKVRDMKLNNETYNYYFSRFSDGTFENTFGFQELDLSCGYLRKTDGTLVKTYEQNFAKTRDIPGACDAIKNKYPRHFSKYFNNGFNFKEIMRLNNLEKINIIKTLDQENRLASSINSDFNFTDGKLCSNTVKDKIVEGENEYATISYCQCQIN